MQKTGGTLQEGYFVDGSMRAIITDVPTDIIVQSQIVFLGASDVLINFNSGNYKSQFCHQMRREDQDNLYYFCLEFGEKATILKKEGSPKEWNYTTLDSSIELPPKVTSMKTITDGSNLELYLNETLVCKANDTDYKDGNIGVRSDNVKIFFNTKYYPK